ncbi:MAG: hypothetical protein BroJett018_48000 [Chloroflexota bacterium]|nr:hypothetical protein [Chloroflexota bacterium]NOG65841.1 hypothetical protein [Chloroflexota bacterium]GIK67006.1 MAG: hypothetical protein BroJett018_48000 [Chloroflexota bacterium]
MTVTFEELVHEALQLSPEDQAKLVSRIVNAMGQNLQGQTRKPLPDLYGSWADLGFDISEEDIDAVRRDVWANFPREDMFE